MHAQGGKGRTAEKSFAADKVASISIVATLFVATLLIIAVLTTASAQQDAASAQQDAAIAQPDHQLVTQRVIFTSDRADPRAVRQNEIFVYDRGSELRLTDTPVWAEYDPVPSPDGAWIVTAATNFLYGFTSFDDEWSWRYVLVDENGRQHQSWSLEGSSGSFRPAGGYQIAWLPDGRSFLANAYDDTGDWRVVRYVLDSAQTIALGQGYETVLHPDGERFATSHNGIIYLVEIATGERTTLAGGRPLGWSADGSELIFEQGTTLFRARPEDPDRLRILGDAGPYVSLRNAPGGERYAVASIAGEASSIVFYDADHELAQSWLLAESVVALEWLDDAWLVIELVDPDGRRLELLSIDGDRIPFVDSFADDASPRVLP